MGLRESIRFTIQIVFRFNFFRGFGCAERSAHQALDAEHIRGSHLWVRCLKMDTRSIIPLSWGDLAVGWAFRPSGFMQAESVLQMVAGYVNSGQHSIQSRFTLAHLRRLGNSYKLKSGCFWRLIPVLGGWIRRPVGGFVSGHHRWGLWMAGLWLPFARRIFGGWSQWITALWGVDLLRASSAWGAHAAECSGFTAHHSRGGPPSGELSGGNWIGHVLLSSRSERAVPMAGGAFGVSLPHGSAWTPPPLGGLLRAFCVRV